MVNYGFGLSFSLKYYKHPVKIICILTVINHKFKIQISQKNCYILN